ncbi:hypothetical protein Cgig2_018432 [Carnegiea gigantea]|uniref:R13L1/DRL21-like LRR repeat region domain-containing protein n=1 Tax=Carnegiea gigantea TaxID=171969 RepID=A0A9Q1K7A7_9CARY|nr:hypothetical protein Cgig2_018432 [Carnegiea gigantea]
MHFPLDYGLVSDHDQNQFNIKPRLGNILNEKGEAHIDDLTPELTVHKLRNILDKKEYLLMLDDVWTKNPADCHKLVDVLTSSLNRQVFHLYDTDPMSRIKGFITRSRTRAYVQENEAHVSQSPFPLNTLVANWSQKPSTKQEAFGGLKNLRALRSLSGHLIVWITENYKHTEEQGTEGGYLRNLCHIKSISIEWPPYSCREARPTEDLLEDLQPHCNLRELEVRSYCGVRIPRWATENSRTIRLPNLAKIALGSCCRLQELPQLDKLHPYHTQSVELANLEYIENRTSGTRDYEPAHTTVTASNSTPAVEMLESSSLPFLKELKLSILPKLKRW